ncbi:hypothetical protein AQI95_09590 [Streptomyces yokosukanensis]|uniref:Scaffolding protein n=1 Tax=Streptomyces yokosukanensis TaxID=67386 RepID=A0A101PBT7_9ACTN|nr:hypothetical protein [Streptomyces yokosukanensis]KUN08596.1 hypothetical protein AQI95_09590 [Streptomyces yokosukanensis]
MSEQTPAPTDEQTSEHEQLQGESPSPESQAGASESDLPEWARKELTKVRGEAASYRTRLRDAESKLSEAKSPEEFEAALAEVKAKDAELERSVLVGSVARRFELPDDLASRLRGETPEELESDAKALQMLLAPKAPPSLGGGLNPSDEDDGEMDPRKLARRTRRV